MGPKSGGNPGNHRHDFRDVEGAEGAHFSRDTGGRGEPDVTPPRHLHERTPSLLQQPEDLRNSGIPGRNPAEKPQQQTSAAFSCLNRADSPAQQQSPRAFPSASRSGNPANGPERQSLTESSGDFETRCRQLGPPTRSFPETGMVIPCRNPADSPEQQSPTACFPDFERRCHQLRPPSQSIRHGDVADSSEQQSPAPASCDREARLHSLHRGSSAKDHQERSSSPADVESHDHLVRRRKAANSNRQHTSSAARHPQQCAASRSDSGNDRDTFHHGNSANGHQQHSSSPADVKWLHDPVSHESLTNSCQGRAASPVDVESGHGGHHLATSTCTGVDGVPGNTARPTRFQRKATSVPKHSMQTQNHHREDCSSSSIPTPADEPLWPTSSCINVETRKVRRPASTGNVGQSVGTGNVGWSAGTGNAATGKGRTPRYQRLVVMRHGQRIDDSPEATEWIRGHPRLWDPPLSNSGKTQAYNTGLRLGDMGISRVVCSPFLRCIQTAGLVLEALVSRSSNPERVGSRGVEAVSQQQRIPRVKVSVDSGVCDVFNPRVIKDRPSDDTWFPDLITDLQRLIPLEHLHFPDPWVIDLPKWPESEVAARQRFMLAYERITAQYPGENVLVVSHGDGVSASITTLARVVVYEVNFCGYSHSLRMVEERGFGEWNLVTKSGESGVSWID